MLSFVDLVGRSLPHLGLWNLAAKSGALLLQSGYLTGVEIIENLQISCCFVAVVRLLRVAALTVKKPASKRACSTLL